jgi:hypothetical protein
MNIKLTAANLTKWIAYGQCRVIEVSGFNNLASGNDRYVFLLESPQSANGDTSNVSSLWFPVGTISKYTFGGGGIQLRELLVAISTTQTTLTAPGANGGLDLNVVVESDFLVTPNTTIAGDFIATIANLQVWPSANGYKKLLRLDVINFSGVTAYIVIQASDAALAADSTLIRYPCIDVGVLEVNSFSFGRNGLSPVRKDTNGTIHKGCTIRLSTTPLDPLVFDANLNYSIRAIYE